MLRHTFNNLPSKYSLIIMKFAKSSVVALLAPAAAARFIEASEGNNVQLYPDGYYEESTEKYLVELAPGQTRWVTEDEKWELRRVSVIECFSALIDRCYELDFRMLICNLCI